MIRNFLLLILGIVRSVHADFSEKDYYCFSSGSKSVLLVPSEYPNINSIMYYPFMKKIELSTTLRIEEVDMGDNAKPEVYRVKQEIIDNKVNGQYRFMSQGYILYEAEYLNLKTKKTTVFNKINLDAKGINCI
ncbi:hypothetical protein [Acinetobacter towneri]|uniref:hypothetical protein n=1 Tax=Acinetobacter towneri TaxID=202956 RepID=UPI00209A9477|nr:hypothetical protein [Acinetobacter towneri]MCO8056677.1 hypothetical protein [Acinetobacter towneri]